jgi:AcrR family transcriptional regulator
VVAAGKVFAERGFAGASTDEIAAAAGFTKGAVYSNFASKDELFFAVLTDRVNARLALAREALAESDAPRDGDGLVAVLGRALRNDRDWELLFLEFWQRAVREPAVGRQFAAHRARLRATIAEFIRAAARRRGVRLAFSATHAATLVLALSNGMAIEEVACPGTVPPDLFNRVLIRLFDVDNDERGLP